MAKIDQLPEETKLQMSDNFIVHVGKTRTCRASLSTLKLTLSSVATVTSSTTAEDILTYFLDASENNITVTLPSAKDYTGRIYHFVRVQESPSGYDCVIVPQEGEYINGESSLSLTDNYDRVTIQSNGSNWIVIAR